MENPLITPSSTKKHSRSRDSMQFVSRWLQENFEYSSNSHVAREKIYQEYLDECGRMGIDSLNSASFGKVVRVAFPNVSTRRLGTRGNSKYHYHGIRPKFVSEHSYIMTDILSKPARKLKPKTSANPNIVDWNQHEQQQKLDQDQFNDDGTSTSDPVQILSDLNPNAQLPSDAWFDAVTLKFPSPSLVNLSSNIDSSLVISFLQNYRFHCRECLQMAAIGNFKQFSNAIIGFWQHLPDEYQHLVCTETLLKIISEWDSLMYQHVMSICIPDLLQELTDTMILNKFQLYLKHAENITAIALKSYPKDLLNEKHKVLNDTCKLAEQYKALNKLACHVTRILESNSVPALIDTWKGVDNESVIVYSFSICPNVYEILRMVHETVLQKLVDRDPISRWAEWIFGTFEDCVPSEIPIPEDYLLLANQFLIRWSYISSLVMKDIRERQPDLFEKFNTIRMFVDDYMKFAIDCKYEEKKRIAEMNYNSDWQPVDTTLPLQQVNTTIWNASASSPTTTAATSATVNSTMSGGTSSAATNCLPSVLAQFDMEDLGKSNNQQQQHEHSSVVAVNEDLKIQHSTHNNNTGGGDKTNKKTA